MKKIIISLLLLCGYAAGVNSQAKYIFYFIGDGMGMGHVNATETYNRDVLGNTEPILMLTFPVASQVRTYSYNSPITDSAAAGTALSTGSKTVNSRVGMAPDSTNIYSIASDFLKAGYEVGVATTVTGDDATPAAFYSHAITRKMPYHIAPQAITSGFAFLGAPAWKGMTDEKGKTNDWKSRMAAEGGYTIVKSLEEYKAAPAHKKTLLVDRVAYDNQAGFTIDSIQGALTAEELTEVGLRQLYDNCQANSAPGFFLMIEGGNIDWAAHANDGGGVIKEVLNFQNAINVAYQFYLQHPDETLIIVTADHDTGGMALGRRDNSKAPDLSLIDYQRISKDRFSNWCREVLKRKKTISWEEMKSFLTQNLGLWGALKVTAAEEKALRRDFNITFIERTGKDEKALYNSYTQFASSVFELVQKHLGIGWTTGYHTGNFVPLYALGVDAGLFTRNLNNIEVPALILKAAGLER